MKGKGNIFAAVLAVLLCAVGWFPTMARASEPLDEIRLYEIDITPRQDGTVDMKYHIKWEVLSDKGGTEPVDWVEIGVANEKVNQIKPLTDNIKKIGYSSSGGGNYIRIDFTERYYKGDVFDFEFSFHQEYLYRLDEKGVCRYSFTPAWFDTTPIDELHIRWNAANYPILSSDAGHKDEKYHEWYKVNMEPGTHMGINVRYDAKTFDVSEERQYKEKSTDGDILIVLFAVVVAVIIVAVIAVAIIDGGGYSGGSGFGGGSHSTFISSCACACVRSSCACVRSSCACACASHCACASSGRAGCSVKYFYSTEGLEDICTKTEKSGFRKLLGLLGK